LGVSICVRRRFALRHFFGSAGIPDRSREERRE